MLRIIVLSLFCFILQAAAVLCFQRHHFAALASIDVRYLTLRKAAQKRVFLNIQKVAHANEEKKPAVFLLGGSVAREFFPAEAELGERLSASVYNLAVSAQTLIDSIRLVENIELQDGTIVYPLTPGKFLAPLRDEMRASKYEYGAGFRYPLQSDTVENIFQEHNVSTENMFHRVLRPLNLYTFLLVDSWKQKVKLTKQFLRGESSLSRVFKDTSTPAQFLYDLDAVPEDRLKRKLARHKKNIRPRIRESLTTRFELLSELIALTRRKGLRFALVELPYGEIYQEVLREEIGVYKEQLDEFVRREGVLRIPFDNARYGNHQKYFYDHVHLLTAGREYYNTYSLDSLRYVLDHSH